MGGNSDRSVLAGIGLTMAVLVAVFWVNYSNVRQLNEDARSVAHTHDVQGQLSDAMRMMSEALLVQRMYLFTLGDQWLTTYESSMDAAQQQLAKLALDMRENPRQLERVRSLERLNSSLREQFDQEITQRRQGKSVRDVLAPGNDRLKPREAIRTIADEMRREEDNLLTARQQASDDAYRFAIASGIISLIVALGTFAAAGLLVRRNLQQRTRSAARIREERERLSVTLASIGDAVIATDTEGRVTLMNEVARGMTGWSHSDASGKPLSQVFAIINEETRAVTENPVARVLREGRIVGLANHTVLISRDGVERPIADSAAPIKDAQGNVLGTVLVFRDVSSERKEEREHAAQAQLMQLRVELSTTLALHEDLPEVLQKSAEIITRLLGVSLTRLWTLDREQQTLVLGASAGITTPVDAERTRIPLGSGKIGGIASSGRPVLSNQAAENPSLNPGNWMASTGIVAFAGYPLQVEDHVSGVLAVFSSTPLSESAMTDLGSIAAAIAQCVERHRIQDERQRTADALREADRRKDEFLATLAHELRNPLSPLTAAAQLLSRGPVDAERKELVGVMLRQLEQLQRLIDDLLDVSRISRGKLSLRQETVDVREAVTAAIDVSRSIIDEAEHQFDLRLPDRPLLIRGDRVRVSQVVGNLLINAAKYTPPGGRIELHVDERNGEACVRVVDNGIGIPRDKLSSIFDVFSQVDTSHTRSQGGLGIGLTLAKTLVEMQGGSIHAESEGQGRGSQFTVRFPKIELSDVEPSRASSPAAKHSSVERRFRFLVVDDNRSALEMLRRLLEALGQEVSVSDSAQRALDHLTDFAPDVVISDVAMPQLSGYDLAQKIRANGKLRQPLLVALTGYGQASDKQEALAAGFDEHITKPIGLEGLRQLLQALPARLERSAATP